MKITTLNHGHGEQMLREASSSACTREGWQLHPGSWLLSAPFSGRLQRLFVVFLAGSHRTGTCQTAQVLPGPSKELVLSRHLLAGVATGGRAAPELTVSDLSPEFLSSSCKGLCLLPKAKSARETHSLCCGCPGQAARSQLREMGFGWPAALGP